MSDCQAGHSTFVEDCDWCAPPDLAHLFAPPLNEKQAPTGKSKHKPIDWGEFWENVSDDVEWILEPLIAKGESIAIYSPAKAGKSLLSLEMVAALASGRLVLGNPAQKPISVVYIDQENTHTNIRQRLEAFGYGPEDNFDNLHYYSFIDLAPLDTKEGAAELLAIVLEHDAQLVIIDTLSRVIKGNENDADTFKDFYSFSLVPLKGRKVAVMRLDHSGKDLEKGQRGSSAKDSDVDAVWLLTAQSETHLYLKRKFSRSPHGADSIDLERKVPPLRHEVTTAKLALRADVLAVIEKIDQLKFDISAGKKTIRQAFTKEGIKCGNDLLVEAIRARKQRAEEAANQEILAPQGVQDTPLSPRSPKVSRTPDQEIDESAGQRGPGHLVDTLWTPPIEPPTEGVHISATHVVGGGWTPGGAGPSDALPVEVFPPLAIPGICTRCEGKTLTGKPICEPCAMELRKGLPETFINPNSN